MKNVLQRKHQRNKKRYFKRKHLEKRYAPSVFLVLYSYSEISVSKWNDQQNLLIYQRFFYQSFYNFTNSVINRTHSE